MENDLELDSTFGEAGTAIGRSFDVESSVAGRKDENPYLGDGGWGIDRL